MDPSSESKATFEAPPAGLRGAYELDDIDTDTMKGGAGLSMAVLAAHSHPSSFEDELDTERVAYRGGAAGMFHAVSSGATDTLFVDEEEEGTDLFSWADVDDLEPMGTDAEPPSPGPLYALERTHFASSLDGPALLARVSVALTDAHAVLDPASKCKWRIRGNMFPNYERVTFVARFFTVDGLRVVELSREQGPSRGFHDLYRTVVNQLRSVVAKEASGAMAPLQPLMPAEEGHQLVVPAEEEEREESLRPIRTMLASQFGDAKLEACRLCACLTANPDNVEALAASQVLPAVFQLLDHKNPDISRCALATAGNVVRAVAAKHVRAAEAAGGALARLRNQRELLSKVLGQAADVQQQVECRELISLLRSAAV
eukprot:CAMPEP_0196780150 /NCGR_PEP_ID=MMETSP1104-20130614/7237_1 /TAXON_ID=33652 /ORGANISM="Cafeteria sp., Strain Caron Lab Isolate" /LENGTH=371 /DNA_ID=CAMNT_0042150341 /DNA_START=78 /DNA_END=1193 /DNA_ORIENTATION=-